MNVLINLNHEEFQKVKIIKVLEGQLAAMDYDELQFQLNFYSNQLLISKQNLIQATTRNKYLNIGELLAELEQKERIIVHLVNILRNLDDKILYSKSNKSWTHHNWSCSLWHNYCHKHEYTSCTYHSKHYHSVASTSSYLDKKDSIYWALRVIYPFWRRT